MKSSIPAAAVQFRDQADVDQAPLDAAGLVAAVSEIAATVAGRVLAQQPPAVVRVPYPIPAPAPAPIDVHVPAPAGEPAPPQPVSRLFWRAEVVLYAGLASSATAGVTTVATLLFRSPWTLVFPLVGLLTACGAAIVSHHQDPGPGRHIMRARIGVDRHGRPVAESGSEHLLASPSLRAVEGGRS